VLTVVAMRQVAARSADSWLGGLGRRVGWLTQRVVRVL